jgi:hypothetical protein
MTLSLKQKYIKTISMDKTRKLKKTEARGGTKNAKTVQEGGVTFLERIGWKNAPLDKKNVVLEFKDKNVADDKAAAERSEAERAEAERAETERAEAERAEAERAERAEVERAEAERAEKVVVEKAAAEVPAEANAEAKAEEERAAEARTHVKAEEVTTTTAPNTKPPCRSIKEIQDYLTKIGITSFEKTEGKGANSSNMGSEMQKYDKREKKMLALENAIKVLHLAGCAVPVVSSYAEVILGLATGLSNFNKSRALTYLASQCLSYVATISKNLSEMLVFYNNQIVKDNEIAIDNKLYGALQKNLYTFLYFLIDSINFRINDDVGLQHYSYWHNFLLKVDFSGNSDYTSSIPSTKYRYSCIECIPSDTLREKMRTTLEKKYVTLENQWFISTIKSTIKSIPGRTISSFTGAPRPPEVNYFGFCSEDVLTVCKNYNDNIMRLIELNMYILIQSASENRERIPILKNTDEDVSAEFYNAVFSTRLITKQVEEEFRIKFRIPVNVTAKREDFYKRAMKGQVYSRVYKIFDNEPDLQVSFDFLIQLNRIISELQHPGFMGNTSNKIISSSNFNVRSGISRAVGVAGYTGYAAASFTTGLIRSPVNFIISDTKLQYEELLREYTLMTGNFLMLTSSFILDKTKLDKDQTERVNNELTETLKKLESSIAILTNDIAERAQSVEKTASNLATETGVVGENPQRGSEVDSPANSPANSPVNTQGDSPANTPANTQGGRSLSKKKYNFSKKRKTKRNKRKRRAF